MRGGVGSAWESNMENWDNWNKTTIKNKIKYFLLYNYRKGKTKNLLCTKTAGTLP